MRYVITHSLFSRQVLEAGSCRLFMEPRDLDGQHVHSHHLEISPEPGDRADHLDLYGNRFTYFAIDHPHRLTVTATSEIDLSNGRPLTDPAQRWEAAAVAAERDPLAADFLLPSRCIRTPPNDDTCAAGLFVAGRPLLDCLRSLAERLSAQPGAEVSGRDLAHLVIATCRSMGLASRYVIGYVESPNSSMASTLRGAGMLHSWAAVRDADGIWIDVDPSNGVVEPVSHLALGWGRDSDDIAPIRRAEHRRGFVRDRFESAVDVRRAARRDGRQRGSLKAGRERLMGLG